MCVFKDVRPFEDARNWITFTSSTLEIEVHGALGFDPVSGHVPKVNVVFKKSDTLVSDGRSSDNFSKRRLIHVNS